MHRTGGIYAALAAVAAVSLAADAARGAVVFGYEVNSSPQQAMVSFDGSELAMQDATGTTVDLTAKEDGASMVHSFAAASVMLDAELTGSTALTNATLLHFSGQIVFNDSASEHVVTFTFDDASLYLPDGATGSALTWSSGSTGGDVMSGEAMASMLGDDYLDSPGDFSLTLTHLSGDASSFEARSSFSASATVVPTPTSLAVLGVLGAGLVGRRRR